MSGEAYYKYQAIARRFSSAEDLETATDCMAPVYSRVLSTWLPPDHNAAIYEVACGPGIMLRYLKRAGYTNLSASDSSECQTDLAKAAGFHVADADSLEDLAAHSEGRWDCVIGIDFIEHLPKDVLIHFFSLARQKLGPGGRLILRAPNGDSPFVGRNLFNDITHVWAYTTIAMRALLQMAGFTRVEFADESMAMVERHRWLKVPLMKCSQALLRWLIRSATREQIEYLNPSIYICAWK